MSYITKIRISSIVLLLAIGLLFSSSKNKSSESPTSGTLLWKIESDAQTTPSYLYGTLHMLPKEDFFIADDALKCLKSSKSLTLEVDMDMSIKEQIAVAQKMMLPHGKTLKDYMSSKDYELLYLYLKDSIGIKDSKIERYIKFKPVNLIAFVCNEYYGDLKMYEQEFTKLAKKNNIHVNGLETVEQQLVALESSGVDMEMPTADDMYFIAAYEEMKDIYLQKNIDSLTSYIYAEMEEGGDKYADVESKLLVERNKNWIPILDSIVKNESSFIAVGAGHLGGEQGVISLLRNKGYKLTPVSVVEVER